MHENEIVTNLPLDKIKAFSVALKTKPDYLVLKRTVVI